MKTLKNLICLCAMVLFCTPIFSQVKNYDESYQQEMGKALDELSPQQMEQVLEFATTLVEKENTRKALACIATNLSKEDQQKLLRHTQNPKPYYPMPSPADLNPIPDVLQGPTTTIDFEETTFNFGELNEGEKISHVYKFTNTGSEALIIKNAKGSCGCTVPKWPKEPIPPGGTGEMIVEFNSKGKKGPQNRRITITANTQPVNTYLTLKGEVNKNNKNNNQ